MEISQSFFVHLPRFLRDSFHGAGFAEFLSAFPAARKAIAKRFLALG
ncbi:MAG: hypothetical protein WBA39_00170 [Rivularia sp. (in: cyanobacteria)]